MGTWTSPDGNTVNQIDHVMVNRRFRTAVTDVRSYRGADCDSDHFMVVTRVKVKIKKTRNSARRIKRPDIEKLNIREERERYQVAVQNRIEQLEEINMEWKDIVTVLDETAVEVLGEKPRNHGASTACM